MKQIRGFTLLELAIVLAVISIVGGGLFLVFRQSPRRDIENAALQLQADIRYIQRQAIAEGRRYRIELNRGTNSYRILAVSPYAADIELWSANLKNNVRFSIVNSRNTADSIFNISFLPRGTVAGATTVTLINDYYELQLTVNVGNGRVDINLPPTIRHHNPRRP